MKQISSRENAVIKHAASLKIGKYRRQEKMFLLEGERAVQELADCPERVVRFFIQDDMLAKYSALSAILGDDKGYIVNEKVIKHICDTGHPQGIAAVVAMIEWDFAAVLQKRGLWLLLNGVSDPGNMGAIISPSSALQIFEGWTLHEKRG